jgi:hypothetical protein
MIEILITDEMRELAKAKADEMGTLRNSISNGDGNTIGFLGELLANQILKGTLKNTYEYDLVLDNGSTVDVKTKRAKVKPKGYYECSVAAYNTKQQCDYYCFVRVTNDLTRGWVLGMIKKDDYYKEAQFRKKGELDGDNSFEIKADCYNLKIDQLTPVL